MTIDDANDVEEEVHRLGNEVAVFVSHRESGLTIAGGPSSSLLPHPRPPHGVHPASHLVAARSCPRAQATARPGHPRAQAVARPVQVPRLLTRHRNASPPIFGGEDGAAGTARL